MANLQLDPPQPPPYHLPFSSSCCPLHPLDTFTTFCPSCLRDRLSSLESPSPSATTTNHRNSTSSNLFKPTGGPHDSDLRRCKSFSFARCGAGGNAAPFDPQRNSCDVRRHVIIANNEIDEMAAKPVLEEDVNSRGLKSFWTKLQKWRRKKHNPKKEVNKQEAEKPDPKSSSSRRFLETQSEVAVDAFGRRSCDVDPRFSLDAGRVPFEDSRYSFDEPRASWVPPMLALVEDSPTRIPVQRFDSQIPVEEAPAPAQTRDYYCSDSLSGTRSRRTSLDRSGSVRRSSFEMSEVKPTVSNGRFSPCGNNAEFLCGEWSSTSFRDDLSESSFRDDSLNNKSKARGKGWNLWGLIHRKNSNSSSSSNTRVNVVERSVSEQHCPSGYANGRLLRSNSNASSRSLSYSNGGFGSMRKVNNGAEKKRKDEFVLERNRSARHSSGHTDNGMSRFYATTAMNGSRRESGKNKPNSASYHSFSRGVHGLY